VISRLQTLGDRRVGDRDRPGLFALASGAIVAVALVLLALPAGHQPHSQPTGPPTTRPSAPVVAAAERAAPSGQADATARRFLGGYLRLLYGRRSAAALAATTARVRHRLARTQSPRKAAARGRHPRILRLEVVPVRGGRFAAMAQIGDGARRYPIDLLLRRRPGGWRVVEVSDH
jgi:hypothetical protein